MIESFYTQPPTCESLCAAVDTLRRNYPMLKTFPIGRTVMGREIHALCIGNPVGCTLFVGATHGLEWLTTLVLLRFCHELLDGLKYGTMVSEIDVRRAMRTRSLVIVPCLNPDGVEIALSGEHWQANANGVDLNHNFDAGWCTLKEMELEAGINAPAPTRYGGKHPHSEPETIAIAEFCVTHQPRTLYSFHSQGEEIFYRYGDKTPPRSQLMAQILASSSGYDLSAPTGLASHGGLKDWFIEKFRRPGFTIEIGRGQNPLEPDQLSPIYDKIQEMLIIATLL